MSFEEIIIKYPMYVFLFCLVFSYPTLKILLFISKLLRDIISYLIGKIIQKYMEQNMTPTIRDAKICYRDGMESKTLLDLFLLVEQEINKLKKRIADLEKSSKE